MQETRCGCVAVRALACSALLSPLAAGQEVHAITHARVEVGNGTVLEGATVVLRGALIEAVGTGVEVPGDAQVIDATGLRVRPGWIDAFSTRGLSTTTEGENPPMGNAGPLPDFAQESHAETDQASRVGIHPERRARDLWSFADADQEPWRLQGFTMALSAPSQGFLRGQSSVMELSGKLTRDALVAEPGWLHLNFRAGGSRRGGGPPAERPAAAGSGYPGTLMATLVHVRQAFLDARRLHGWEELFRRQPRGTARPPHDTALQVLWEALDGTLAVAVEADSENDILRALRLCDEFRLRPVLIGGGEAWKVAEVLKAAQVPVVAGLSFPDAPKREGLKEKKDESSRRSPERGGNAPAAPGAGVAEEPPAAPSQDLEEKPPEQSTEKSTEKDPEKQQEPEVVDPVNLEPEKVFAEREALWLEEVQNVARLLDAGVVVALSCRGHDQPKAFMDDLQVALEKGLDPARVEQAFTAVPARLFGISEHTGTIEAGKSASLVITEGELTPKGQKIRWVFAGGRKFESKKQEEPGAKPGADAAADVPAIDLGGTWEISGEEASLVSTLALVHQEGALSGSLKNSSGEWQIKRGSVQGNTFEIVVEVTFQTQSFDFTFRGSVEGNHMTGTLETPFGEPSTFQGQRKPEVRR